MTTAKVGPTQQPDVPLCPEMHGYSTFKKGEGWGFNRTYVHKAARDENMIATLRSGYPVRPYTIPAPTPSPAGEADSIEAVANELANLIDMHRTEGIGCNDFLIPFYRRLRRLQPTREMPEAVDRLCINADHYAKVFRVLTSPSPMAAQTLEANVAAVRAHYATPAPAPDAVPVVRVTHGVQSVESGLILNPGDEAACRKFCDEYTTEVYRLVRLALGGGA